jgi:hypothetical protein
VEVPTSYSGSLDGCRHLKSAEALVWVPGAALPHWRVNLNTLFTKPIGRTTSSLTLTRFSTPTSAWDGRVECLNGAPCWPWQPYWATWRWCVRCCTVYTIAVHTIASSVVTSREASSHAREDFVLALRKRDYGQARRALEHDTSMLASMIYLWATIRSLSLLVTTSLSWAGWPAESQRTAGGTTWRESRSSGPTGSLRPWHVVP